MKPSRQDCFEESAGPEEIGSRGFVSGCIRPGAASTRGRSTERASVDKEQRRLRVARYKKLVAERLPLGDRR